MKEDVLHRLVDIWAAGEAGASLGFETARLFDHLDPMERERDRLIEQKGLKGTAVLKLRKQITKDAIEYLNGNRLDLAGDILVETALLDCIANVLCPACKLWNTGHGSHMMREAVSLMLGDSSVNLPLSITVHVE